MTEFETHPVHGWVTLTKGRESGVVVSVGTRGIGHDEPPVYSAAWLADEDAEKLLAGLAELLARSSASPGAAT